MPQQLDLRVHPDHLDDNEWIKRAAAMKLQKNAKDISSCTIKRRSIDARGRTPMYQLKVEVVLVGEEPIPEPTFFNIRKITNAKSKVLIIGAGPAGYLAAMRCLELNLKPIVIERGYNVRLRRKDLRQIQQFNIVNPDSNYCFGEGGAGTYSDGKLYTRANKRGNVRKILQILVAHGANSDILIDSHPHIGSNKLPQVVQAIRETIIENGGEVLFDHRVVDFIIKDKKILGVQCQNGIEVRGDACVLATGHSARDIYHMCQDNGVQLEFKPFAIGVRMEHPQELIDKIQYNQSREGINLPAASYGLSCQADGHGVYSFCMCPGGLIVPAATSPGELVVNGMSLSRRDSPFANAATVVTLDKNPSKVDPFGGLKYQEELERAFFNYGDRGMKAPAQRLTDFMDGKVSSTLRETSYIPGIYSAPIHEMLPEWIVASMKKGIRQFDQRMRGYYTEEAQLIGLESRTSAPIRIPRDKELLMSADIDGLFPCGEGAGYAGGILSAALDGDKIVDKIKDYIERE